METQFEIVFALLKEILQKYSGPITVKPDTNKTYDLYAHIEPATL